MNATTYNDFSLPAPISSRLRLAMDVSHRDTNPCQRRSLQHSAQLPRSLNYDQAKTPATSFSHLLSSTFCCTWRYLPLLRCRALIHHSPTPRPASRIPQFRTTPMSYIRVCEHHHLLIYKYFPSTLYSIYIYQNSITCSLAAWSEWVGELAQSLKRRGERGGALGWA